MAHTYKVLGQALSNTSEVTVYTVPSSTNASLSTISITNTDDASHTYTISFIPNSEVGSPTANKHIAVYNKTILPSQTHEIKGGITLSSGDQARVSSDSSELVVNIYGVELS